jgi:hypothetical protein
MQAKWTGEPGLGEEQVCLSEYEIRDADADKHMPK